MGGPRAPSWPQITGVPDAVFSHTKRFYVSARSREGILALARLALDA